jgi:ribosomal protein S18 acetylase RimI-like enzyme
MNVCISPITESDVVNFRECLDSVCREGRFLATLEAPPLEQAREFVSRQIEAGNPMLVATSAREVVGWCDITPHRQALHSHRGVLGMGVKADLRGLGIGRRLLTATLEAAHRRGLERVELVVNVGNVAAVHLYQSAGFETEATIRHAVKLHGSYEDAYSMSLFFNDPRA